MIAWILTALILTAPCERAEAIEKGSRTHCSGLLVPVLEARACLRVKAIEMPMCRADLDHCIEAKRAEGEAYTQSMSALTRQSRELERLLSEALVPEPWWHDPYVGFTVGVVTASLVAVTLSLRE